MQYVYLLLNEHMPGLVKIGYTEREPEARAAELSSPTGVPGEFRVHASWAVDDGRTVEGLVFAELAPYRLLNQEFFRLTPDEARRLIQKVVIRYKRKGFRSLFDALIQDPDLAEEALEIQKELWKREEERRRLEAQGIKSEQERVRLKLEQLDRESNRVVMVQEESCVLDELGHRYLVTRTYPEERMITDALGNGQFLLNDRMQLGSLQVGQELRPKPEFLNELPPKIAGSTEFVIAGFTADAKVVIRIDGGTGIGIPFFGLNDRFSLVPEDQ